MASQKVCFVISPIGETASPQRKRADIILKHILKPAIEPMGYDVIRADEISQPGSITLQVLEKILESELVVADLTDHNPNVFYELAVRHATQKPVIHVILAGQKIPFDVADLRTISVYDADLDGAEKAKHQIKDQIEEIEAGRIGETPIKVAGALKHLSGGAKADEQIILKQILDAIAELTGEFRQQFSERHKKDEAFKHIMRAPSSDTGLDSTKYIWTTLPEPPSDVQEMEVEVLLTEALKLIGDKLKSTLSLPRADGKRNWIVTTQSGRVGITLVERGTPTDVIANAILKDLNG